jgi:hypothetical protein
VTIAKRPFGVGRDGGNIGVIGCSEKKNIFSERAGQTKYCEVSDLICPSSGNRVGMRHRVARMSAAICGALPQMKAPDVASLNRASLLNVCS